MAKKANINSSSTVRKLSDLVNPDDFKSPYTRCQDVLHEPLVLLGVEWTRGNRGIYMRLDVLRIRTHESIIIQTGAWPIKAMIERLEEVGGFPTTVSIINDGQTYRFVDANLPPNFDVSQFIYGMTQPQLDYPTPTE